MILVWFYSFDWFGCFRVTDGSFNEFVIFLDYIAPLRCLGFCNIGGLRVSFGVD